MYIVPTVLTEVFYPLQKGKTALNLAPGDTPLHLVVREGYIKYMEHLLSTPGIDVDTVFETNYCYY